MNNHNVTTEDSDLYGAIIAETNNDSGIPVVEEVDISKNITDISNKDDKNITESGDKGDYENCLPDIIRLKRYILGKNI